MSIMAVFIRYIMKYLYPQSKLLTLAPVIMSLHMDIHFIT